MLFYSGNKYSQFPKNVSLLQAFGMQEFNLPNPIHYKHAGMTLPHEHNKITSVEDVFSYSSK